MSGNDWTLKSRGGRERKVSENERNRGEKTWWAVATVDVMVDELVVH